MSVFKTRENQLIESLMNCAPLVDDGETRKRLYRWFKENIINSAVEIRVEDFREQHLPTIDIVEHRKEEMRRRLADEIYKFAYFDERKDGFSSALRLEVKIVK